MGAHSILADLLILLASSLPPALALRRLGQSTIVGYLLTGLIIGPAGLGLIPGDSIQTLAEIGVGLLLFTIGIELSLPRLAEKRRIAFGGGSLQVGLTAFAAAAIVTIATGWLYQGVFVGCAIALSSSAIVLKTLADRGDLDAPYTSAATSVAIFQDLAIVPMMVILPALGSGSSLAAVAVPALAALARAGALLAILYLGSRYLIDRLLYRAALTRSPEIFVITVITLLLAAAYGSARAGLSLALGGFIGGLLLTESAYAQQILAEVKPFKDVFQAIFFVSIGMLLVPAWVIAHPGLVGATVVAVIAGKTLLAAVALLLVGVPARTATATGVVLSQVGEFSFVLIALGRSEGLLSEDIYQLTLATAIATMALAPLLIANVRSIVDRLGRVPGIGKSLSGAAGDELGAAAVPLSGHVIVCGFGPVGRDVATFLADHGIEFVVIELNPKTVRESSEMGLPIFFGDFSNPHVLEQAGIARARALVVAAPDLAAAKRAVRIARGLNPDLEIVARTKYRSLVASILEAGANEVIEEEFETALEMVARLTRTLEIPRRVIARHMAGQRLERYGLQRAQGQDRGGQPLLIFDVEVTEVREGSALAGRTIAEADIRGRTGATILAVERDGAQTVNPPPTYAIAARDRIACVGTSSQLDAVGKLAKGEVEATA